MPAQRLSMRKIKEVLRLCWANGLSKRKTARSCGISRPAVDEYLRRAETAGLSWPLPAELDDGTLERLLFPTAPTLPAQVRGLPDWSMVHRELKRKGVTLFLPEQEQRHPLALQLPVDRGPVRQAAHRCRQCRRRREQQAFQRAIIQLGGQWPGQAGRFGPAQVLIDGRTRDATTPGGLSFTQAMGPAQA